MTAWRALGDGRLSADDVALLDAAESVRARAYAPYSGFRVGAAIRCDDGSIATGCNVENAAYPAGVCAERGALARAIADGRQVHLAVAVVGSRANPTTPCGMCRQALNELSPELRVLAAGSDGAVDVRALGQLLPQAFGPSNLAPPSST